MQSNFIIAVNQAVDNNLLLKQKEESGITNRLATDPAVEVRGSDSWLGLECLLNIVRALGMGSCLSGDVTSPRAVPCSQESTSDYGKHRTKLKTSSFDSKIEPRLHRVPGRLFLNGSSEVASLFCKQGKKGINQDAMLVWENFCSREDTIFCGVFDGHGPYGHRVAKKVRDSFPLKLSAQWELHHMNKDGYTDISRRVGGHKSEENGLAMMDENSMATFTRLKESFLKACKVMDKELKLHPDVDCFCSGTTAVTMVKQGLDLVISNIGDSRAILGTRDHDGSLIAVQLTIDLKPNLPREEERIRLCRGRVFSLQHEPDVARVWLPNVNSPGLAMARAFGDFCLKDYGLISVPDVSYHRLTEKDEFVVLATDGIWDVLSNEEVVDVVASAPRSSAARSLVESAVRTWRMKYPTAKVDDCAAVCLFFDSDSDLKSAYSGDKDIPEASNDQCVADFSGLAETSPERVPLGEKGIETEVKRQQ